MERNGFDVMTQYDMNGNAFEKKLQYFNYCEEKMKFIEYAYLFFGLSQIALVMFTAKKAIKLHREKKVYEKK